MSAAAASCSSDGGNGAVVKRARTLLSSLRSELLNEGIDAFVIGSGDAHQSEYVPESEMRRQFISGFTGSAGTALVLKDKALLWTDGRYFLQASKELSEDWTLMKSGEPGVLEMNEWLAANLTSGETVGLDAFLVSASEAKKMAAILAAKGIHLKATAKNPVDIVWEAEKTRPNALQNPVKLHDAAYAGVSHQDKLEKVKDYLPKQNAGAIVFSMLDEIVWLLNIRGSDVAFNPVVVSYLVVTTTQTMLFVDAAKVFEPSVAAHLAAAGVSVHPYVHVEKTIAALSDGGEKILVDPVQLNWRLYKAIAPGTLIEKPSLLTLQKSIKNDAELAGIRACHVRDGVALTAFLCWLEKTVKEGKQTITEYDVAVKIEEFRSRASPGMHVSPSFSTIAGFAANGAIIHYKPEKETAATLRVGEDAMFLLDSGAQYLDGTTDVTRTIHFGQPTDRMKTCYTAVLKGHIALARAVFPEGTIGSRIDCLARVPLWEAGLDYNHGTGHGVGAFLNVHEGPQGIGFRKRENEAGFAIGMTTSNEPGYYEEGSFGIRIETVCIMVEAHTPNNFNKKRYCQLETVTLTPIKTDMVVVSMLTPEEKEYLNGYHARVRETLMPLMKEVFPEAVQYLLDETKPI